MQRNCEHKHRRGYPYPKYIHCSGGSSGSTMARRFDDCASLLRYTSWAAYYTVYSLAAGATRRQHRCKTLLLLSYHCRTTNTHIRWCLRPQDVLHDTWLKSRGINAAQRGFRCDLRGIGGGGYSLRSTYRTCGPRVSFPKPHLPPSLCGPAPRPYPCWCRQRLLLWRRR